jgi:HSP20 family protein
MTLVRWEPFNELLGVHRRFAGATPGEGRDSSVWEPAVDVFEKGDDLVIRAEIPGVSRDEIDINVENNVLTIRGERKRDQEISAKNAFRLERDFGSFSRSFTLPRTVNVAGIGASYRDGVLELTLPKAEEAKPKRIRIQAA